jgi:AbiV family abortive infection protein
MKNNMLTKKQLIDLFNASIENAMALFDIAFDNYQKEKTAHISLGLSELSLEELGKSYTCLSYLCLGGIPGNYWVDFWKDWKDHNTKAYRAFFYEFFSLLRVEIEGLKGYFPTKRERLPLEKEISFYVDFDNKRNRVVTPFQEIEKMEIYNRVSSLIGPMNSAQKVKDLIANNDNSEYQLAISKYALLTLTSNMYKQNVEEVLSTLKNGNKENDKALSDIWKMFKPKE